LKLKTIIKSYLSFFIKVAASTEVIATQFSSTVLSVQDLNSLSDIQQSWIVIILYGSIWSGGVGAILLLYLRDAPKSQQNITKSNVAPPVTPNQYGDSMNSKEAVRAYLTTYGESCTSVLPIPR
jgi:hypothetical protein